MRSPQAVSRRESPGRKETEDRTLGLRNMKCLSSWGNGLGSVLRRETHIYPQTGVTPQLWDPVSSDRHSRLCLLAPNVCCVLWRIQTINLVLMIRMLQPKVTHMKH